MHCLAPLWGMQLKKTAPRECNDEVRLQQQQLMRGTFDKTINDDISLVNQLQLTETCVCVYKRLRGYRPAQWRQPTTARFEGSDMILQSDDD